MVPLLSQVQRQRSPHPARRRNMQIVDMSCEPIAVETLGVINSSARLLLDEIGADFR